MHTRKADVCLFREKERTTKRARRASATGSTTSFTTHRMSNLHSKSTSGSERWVNCQLKAMQLQPGMA